MVKLLFCFIGVDWEKGKTHLKKSVGPLRFYPPYTNGLVVHAVKNYFADLMLKSKEIGHIE